MKQHFGTLLKEIRKELNLNQVEFSKKIRVQQGTLSKLERGQMGTNAQVVFNVTKVFADTPKIKQKLLRFLFEPSKSNN